MRKITVVNNVTLDGVMQAPAGPDEDRPRRLGTRRLGRAVHRRGAGPERWIDRDLAALRAELRDSGAFVFAGGLHLAAMSTVVDATGGGTVVTDGPYAETKEQLGGLLIVRAGDLDAALAMAARTSVATRLPIEVRPFQGDPD